MSLRGVFHLVLPVAAGLSLALLVAWSTGTPAAVGVVTDVEGISNLI